MNSRVDPVESAAPTADASVAIGALPLHVAVIHAADGVRRVMAEASRAALELKLAEYVRLQSAHALWPEAAERVHRSLAAGRRRAAIELYFAEVGRRWDEELLFTTRVRVALPGPTM
jgi:hypothetical protein